jgi:hypothetical protein
VGFPLGILHPRRGTERSRRACTSRGLVGACLRDARYMWNSPEPAPAVDPIVFCERPQTPGMRGAPELTSRRLSRCADARETSCTKVSRTMALLPPAKSSRAWFRRTPAPGVRAGGACAPGRLEVPALAERRPWRRHPSAHRSAPARDRCCCRQTTWLSCTCPSRRRSTRRRAGPSPKVHLNQGGYF